MHLKSSEKGNEEGGISKEDIFRRKHLTAQNFLSSKIEKNK